MDEAKKRRRTAAPAALHLPAMGMEAECALMLDDTPARPEDVFGSPRDFIRGPLVHRQGKSYQLPIGSAVYFDTGVIEVATPVVEIAPGCGARATRLLWEGLQFLRRELDQWDARTSHATRLVGFSAHYNVSFALPPGQPENGRTLGQLALLLAYILPAPVMLLAANRRSTGVGVRPREDRIEITCDFTPDPALTMATATVIVAIVRAVMAWPSYALSQLAAQGVPIIGDFRPMPHTSRKGWLARFDCYADNPFTCDVDRSAWPTRDHGLLSLRAIAGRTVQRFWRDVRRMADPATAGLVAAAVRGPGASLLDLPDRPAAYEHVGRLCAWDAQAAAAGVDRSRYERVVLRALSGQPLRRDGQALRPVGMRGWSAVVFRREDAQHEVIGLDALLPQLEAWERE